MPAIKGETLMDTALVKLFTKGDYMGILNTFHLRFIARFIIEADTPLSIATGENDSLTELLVATDANGLPMIPGTSLKGLLRHAFAANQSDEDVKSLFGFQNEESSIENDGAGSRILITNAHLIGSEGEIIEGLFPVETNSDFYKKLLELPLRQHCRITSRGVADTQEKGKFDEHVVYKGARFCFEIELVGADGDKDSWITLLNILSDKTFRIGGGTRNGFGSIKIISIKSACFDLKLADSLDNYLEKSASLKNFTSLLDGNISQINESKDWLEYKLSLKPDDFFSFGSGFGDDEVDMTPVYEEFIDWNQNGKPNFKEKQIVIPATSVKGAISHRVAFHYNKLSENYAEDIPKDEIKDITGAKNDAVRILFGCEKNSNTNEPGLKGNVIFSDCFMQNKQRDKIFNHVAIDRFTGGALTGALFDEKVIDQREPFELTFMVKKECFKDNINVKKAFENTLNDICKGMLPLGSGVMRGHGVFIGTMSKNDD